MKRLSSLILVALAFGVISACAHSPPPTPWPDIQCPNGKTAQESLVIILDNAAIDFPMATPAQQTKILQCMNLAHLCLGGGHPPAGDPTMSLVAHCKHVDDAEALSSVALAADKWDKVYNELDHDH